MILNMPLEDLRELKTVVALLTSEHFKTQQFVVFKHSVFFTMYFFFLMHMLFSLPTLNTFFHIFVYVYIYRTDRSMPTKKTKVFLKARHA